MSLIKKSTDSLKRRATFVVLEPQGEDGTTSDLHLDWYDAETIEEACYQFNKASRRANIFHMFHTSGFDFVESYILPVDAEVGGTPLKKGTWLASIEVKDQPEYEYIWAGIVNGTFDGLSIQCLGTVETME